MLTWNFHEETMNVCKIIWMSNSMNCLKAGHTAETVCRWKIIHGLVHCILHTKDGKGVTSWHSSLLKLIYFKWLLIKLNRSLPHLLGTIHWIPAWPAIQRTADHLNLVTKCRYQREHPAGYSVSHVQGGTQEEHTHRRLTDI